MRSHGRGGVPREEVNKWAEQGFPSRVLACLRRRKWRTPIWNDKENVLYWVVFLFSLEMCMVVGSAGPQGKQAAGLGPSRGRMGPGERCEERRQERWTIRGQGLLLWWHSARTNCALIYTQVGGLIHARKHGKWKAFCLSGGATEASLEWRSGLGYLSEAFQLGLGGPVERPLSPAVSPSRGPSRQDKAEEEEKKETWGSSLSQAYNSRSSEGSSSSPQAAWGQERLKAASSPVRQGLQAAVKRLTIRQSWWYFHPCHMVSVEGCLLSGAGRWRQQQRQLGMWRQRMRWLGPALRCWEDREA